MTLDNYTASNEAVTYLVRAIHTGPGSQDPFLETVQVAAGANRVVNVPVTEDTEVSVTVDADFLLTSAGFLVDCTDDGLRVDPQARIGELGDCWSMSVDVTLDNSRGEDEAQYRVQKVVLENPDGGFC